MWLFTQHKIISKLLEMLYGVIKGNTATLGFKVNVGHATTMKSLLLCFVVVVKVMNM